MDFKENFIVMVFVKEIEGRKLYSIGLSKKNKNGSYENGYMSVKFQRDVVINNKTRIKVKEAWLSFNTNENKTFPFIFINDFEVLAEPKPETKETKETNPYEDFGNSIKTEANFEQIEITDDDLPF